MARGRAPNPVEGSSLLQYERSVLDDDMAQI